MPRRPRFDAPGLHHHVMGRGLAHRTMFETRRDVRTFLALLALEVRAGHIYILAYSILTTHYHLLIQSRTGQLSSVMRRVLGVYVRRFNRGRGRDGSLPRCRYHAKPVRALKYRFNAVRYIDQNAPRARLASSASRYPHGSASLYVAPRRPLWLGTTWVDARMGEPTPEGRPAAYARTFGTKMDREEASLIEQRLKHGAVTDDDWDDLINAAPPRVLAWMMRTARLADGTKPGLPYVPASKLVRVVNAEARRVGPWKCLASPKRRGDAWPILRIGLLRDLGGLTRAEISRRVGCSSTTASRREAQHAHLLATDAGYRAVASALASRCLAER